MIKPDFDFLWCRASSWDTDEFLFHFTRFRSFTSALSLKVLDMLTIMKMMSRKMMMMMMIMTQQLPGLPNVGKVHNVPVWKHVVVVHWRVLTFGLLWIMSYQLELISGGKTLALNLGKCTSWIVFFFTTHLFFIDLQKRAEIYLFKGVEHWLTALQA